MRRVLLGLGLVLCLCGTLAAGEITGEKRDLKAIDKVFREPVELSGSPDTAMHVFFRHSDHKNMPCAVCHHLVTPTGDRYTSCGGNVACHHIPGTSTDVRSRFMAFHDRDSERSCYGCHFKERGRFEDVKGCTVCHTQQAAQAR